MNERASQTVPYECLASECDHEECWREYDRQESEYKYRPRAVF